MTTQYINRELAEAKSNLSAARLTLASAKTRKQIREADEDVNFWGNKVAFLESAR